MPLQKFASLDAVVDKLIDTSKVVKNRMKLRPAEEARVDDTFALLAKGRPNPGSTAVANKTHYLELLHRVEALFGSPGIVLCAVGLGVSAVGSLKDRIRVDLATRMKERQAEFERGFLQKIADTYTLKRTRSLETTPVRLN